VLLLWVRLARRGEQVWGLEERNFQVLNQFL
jgi:hypothetical protein